MYFRYSKKIKILQVSFCINLSTLGSVFIIIYFIINSLDIEQNVD